MPGGESEARRIVASALVVFALAAGLGSAAEGRGLGAVRLVLGRSQEGRPIVAVRAGDPSGWRVLVVGCIHGSECAGVAVARALERVRARVDLWIIRDLNPDGTWPGRARTGAAST